MLNRLLRRAGRFVLTDLSPPPYCENVETWCRSHPEARCWHIAEPTTITRRLPLIPTESELHFRFTGHQTYTFPAQYLAEIPNARVCGSNGLVILPDGKFAVEPVFLPIFLQQDSAYRRYLPWEIKRKPGRYYSLLMRSAWSGGYYHWLLDVLPRLYRILERLPDDVIFITPILQDYQRETLHMVGIESDRLVTAEPAKVWELERLFFSPPIAFSSHHLPESLFWLRNTFQQACHVSSTQSGKRLFISREKASKRRLLNQTDILAVLEDFGFETVIAEDLSFCEQVALFSRAEVIVAQHGAGLTNMLFARPHSIVIEMFGHRAIDYAYWTLSDALGFTYYYLVGENVDDGRRDIPRWEFYQDMIIPPEKLAIVLEHALS